MKIINLFITLIILISLPFISADFGYNNPTLPNVISNKILGSDINNDLNWINASGVNGSFYLNSNPFSFYNLSNFNISNYIPYTGATSNLILGFNNFSIGTSDFFVNSVSGNIGIGTDNPSDLLTLSTSINDAGITLIGATTGISPAFKIANATGNIFARFGIAGGTNELVTGSNPNDLVMRTNNQNIFFTTNGGLSPSMIINISGNVGIGVTPSNARLQINGGGVGIGTILAGDLASGSTLAIGDSDTGFKEQGDGLLATYTNNVERTRIDTSGYMGIGTTTPSEKLDVSGNLKVSGDIYTDKWQDYSISTISGFSSFTYSKIRYKKIGNLVLVNYNILGTSNSNVFTFTLPYSNSNQSYSDINAFGVGTDNSVTLSSPHIYLPTDSNIITVYQNWQSSSWTASGTKRMNGQFWYEAN